MDNLLNTINPRLIILSVPLFLATEGLSARNVTLSANNVKVKQALTLITKQTGLSFAYSNQVVNLDRTISIQADNQDLTFVMDKIVEGTDL